MGGHPRQMTRSLASAGRLMAEALSVLWAGKVQVRRHGPGFGDRALLVFARWLDLDERERVP